MAMEVLNLSIDDNDEDTSNEELEDEDYQSIFNGFENSQEDVLGGVCITERIVLEQFKEWERPKVPEDMFYSSSVLEGQPEGFHFFLLDTTSTISGIKHPGIELDPSVAGFKLHNVIRMFGLTTLPTSNEPATEENLNDIGKHDKTNSVSVCCNVHGFVSYFYALPFVVNFDGSDSDEEAYWRRNVQDFERFLNKKVRDKILRDLRCVDYHEFIDEHRKCVAKVEVMKASEAGGIYHYFGREQDRTIMLKIYCTLPRFIWTAYSILSEKMFGCWKFECYEGNINNTVRFLADRNMTGCSWYGLQACKFYLREYLDNPRKETSCQIELDVHFKDIFKLDEKHARYSFHPAVRVLSFDLEVLVSPDSQSVPKDGSNQVIQIAAVLGNYYPGAESKKSIIGKVVFTLGTCDDIEDAKVIQCLSKENQQIVNSKHAEDAEAAMLGMWRDFVVRMDPDFIIGYNIKKFDVPYLVDRSNILGSTLKAAATLPFMGRMLKMKSQIRLIQNDLKRVHQYDEQNVNLTGRVILDLYPIFARHERHRNGNSKGYLKLCNVAKRYLHQEEKHDIHYKDIYSLQLGNSATRNKLARYCLQDAAIPFHLLFQPVPCRSEITYFIDLYFFKSRTGGAPIRYLLNKSISYCEYFKQVRLQKNPGRVFYVPDTPSPKKPLKRPILNKTNEGSTSATLNEPSTSSPIIKVKRNLFVDDCLA